MFISQVPQVSSVDNNFNNNGDIRRGIERFGGERVGAGECPTTR